MRDLGKTLNLELPAALKPKRRASRGLPYLRKLACRRFGALGLSPRDGHLPPPQPEVLPDHLSPGVFRRGVVVKVDEEEAPVLGGVLGVLKRKKW